MSREATIIKVDDAPAEVSIPNDEERYILETAMTRFQEAMRAESRQRARAIEDLKFYAGEQWPQEIVEERQRAGRPSLTVNLLMPLVSLIVNEYRMERPSIVVSPVDGDTDPEAASAVQGIIRHIESISDAASAYDWAFLYAVICGVGYIRVITEYVDETSFDQEIKIQRVLNPFSVYYDPNAVAPDGSDASYAFITDEIRIEEFRTRWPRARLARTGFSQGADGDRAPGWVSGDRVRIAEYFWVERTPTTIYKLPNGRVVTEEELAQMDETVRSHRSVYPSRQTTIPRVRWALITATDILEMADWPGRYIPIVRVAGREIVLNGERYSFGIVRQAVDAQRQYNYMRSAITEAIALAPKAPFVAAAGQIEGFEEYWEQANRRNFAVLPYRPVTASGQLVPPPQRQMAEPAISAIMAAVQQSSADIRAITNIYEPALGARVPKQSGLAISRLQRQSSVANYDYTDSMARSLRYLGRILVDMIPKIYDRPGRIVRILGEDRRPSFMAIGKSGEEPSVAVPDWVQALFDPNLGRYDVTVDVGPAYATRRQEFVATLAELLRNVPGIAPLALDMLVENMDWPGAKDLAKRLKTMLPPEIRAIDQGKEPEVPPAVAAQIQQMEQALQQAQQIIEQLSAQLADKESERKTKERIAELQARAKAAIALKGMQSRERIEELRSRIKLLTSRLKELEKRSGSEDEESLEAEE